MPIIIPLLKIRFERWSLTGSPVWQPGTISICSLISFWDDMNEWTRVCSCVVGSRNSEDKKKKKEMTRLSLPQKHRLENAKLKSCLSPLLLCCVTLTLSSVSFQEAAAFSENNLVYTTCPAPNNTD